MNGFKAVLKGLWFIIVVGAVVLLLAAVGITPDEIWAAIVKAFNAVMSLIPNESQTPVAPAAPGQVAP